MVYGRQRGFLLENSTGAFFVFLSTREGVLENSPGEALHLGERSVALRRTIDEQECWKLAYARLTTGHERGS